MTDNETLADVCIPNLDGFATAAELRTLATIYGRLAAYADLKASAMELRAKGDIEAALSFERTCETTYRKLPEWARW
jgi:hypothetical protein